MKLIVTGGAGFIGSNLVAELIRRGESVTVIDDLSSGKAENLKPILDKIKFVEGSILDFELLKKEFIGIDYVIHLAAIPSVPRSTEKPLETHNANMTGTINVLLAARDAGVKRVVYSGSSSRYGNAEESVKSESLRTNPLSLYALQKFAGEEYCRLFYELYGLETVSLIFFNVFGPNQDPNSFYSAVIPKFIKQIMNGERPTIYGDGKTSRDFTYVDNNVDALIKACTAENVCGEVYNIACGTSITLIELVDMINKHLGKNLEPLFDDFRAGDVKHSKADISGAEKKLGYEVKVNFEEGLKKTIEWYKNE